MRRTVSVGTYASASVSILVYVVLSIVRLRRRFGGLSRAPVAFAGVGRTCDGCLFGTVLGEFPDWFCRVPDLDLADHMPLGMTWRLRPFRYPTRGIGWLRELACGCLDIMEC